MKKNEVNNQGELAKFRTILANDRTLLAYVRTMLSFLILGVGLIALFDNNGNTYILGVFSIAIGVIIILVGISKHSKFKKLL